MHNEKQKNIIIVSQTIRRKSNQYYEASNEGREFLSLGEPIKVGHHSEKRHRALIERNNNRMDKSMEHLKIAEQAESKASYWENKAGGNHACNA